MVKTVFGKMPIQKIPARQMQMEIFAGADSSIGVASATSLLQ